MRKKKGQVTIFIIIAIVVVAGIIAYFVLRDNLTKSLPVEMEPVYDYYLECLQATAREGINLLGQQGGYIEVPDFVPGSSYAPFSSQLNFLGQPVPYWMYVSGNNLLKEQVPTKAGMEQQLEKYVEDRLSLCDFSDFEEMGYDVFVDGEGSVSVSINDFGVDVGASNGITIFLEGNSAIVNNHDFTVDSKLGKFYKMAKKVYDSEKENRFLEEYAVDILRLYAPVTGAEISCSPKVFVEEEIRNDISDGLAANIPAIKLDGSYYTLSSKERDYFVVDSNLGIDENLNFLYSPNWPTKIEIYGDTIAEPVGLQEGMGLMGFCYVPYHFVYDMDFPVLVQFFDNQELFQFPMAVIVSKNQPREALPTIGGTSIESPVCDFKNQPVNIFTYDMDLNPVEAQVSFRCLDAVCEIGETVVIGGDAALKTNLPQCVNGFLVARADGYADAKVQISTNEESLANILMMKKHEVGLDLGNVKRALISFESEGYSTTVVYPETKSVELIEAYYNVTVRVYDNSSLTFPPINERKCVDVPETGIAGFLGFETEKCYDINIPATDVSYAIVGGGKAQEYILEDVLKSSTELNINVPLFGIPQSLTDLQKNTESVDTKKIYLEFQ